MAEHYTKNTLEITHWCNKCQRRTQHRVDSGRKGPCLEHQTPIQEKPKPKPPEPTLFET